MELRQITIYALLDTVGSYAAWLCLNLGHGLLSPPLSAPATFGWGGGYVLLWVVLSMFAGFYHAPFRRARLNELVKTIEINVLGSVGVMLWALAYGRVGSIRAVALLGAMTCAYQMLLTYVPRMLFTWSTVRAMNSGRLSLPTLVVGPEFAMRQLYHKVVLPRGFRVVGSLQLPSAARPGMREAEFPPVLGTSLQELPQAVRQHHIANVVVAGITPRLASQVCAALMGFSDVGIYSTTPLDNAVRTSNIQGPLLRHINDDPMPYWQRLTKLMADYLLSSAALLLLSPLLLLMVLIIKLTSPGPAIYRQERVGRYGRPFTIYKLRSMRTDAEPDGPALSSRTDGRVTPIGRFMRRTHIDEIPNFVNVLRGDMSLVGPRPERQYYIDQIMRRAPDYALLLSMRPGITSWGQVKFGYAENVPQMLQRLRYDLLYLYNRSLIVDFKILIYTAITVFKGAWG